MGETTRRLIRKRADIIHSRNLKMRLTLHYTICTQKMKRARTNDKVGKVGVTQQLVGALVSIKKLAYGQSAANPAIGLAPRHLNSSQSRRWQHFRSFFSNSVNEDRKCTRIKFTVYKFYSVKFGESVFTMAELFTLCRPKQFYQLLCNF